MEFPKATLKNLKDIEYHWGRYLYIILMSNEKEFIIDDNVIKLYENINSLETNKFYGIPYYGSPRKTYLKRNLKLKEFTLENNNKSNRPCCLLDKNKEDILDYVYSFDLIYTQNKELAIRALSIINLLIKTRDCESINLFEQSIENILNEISFLKEDFNLIESLEIEIDFEENDKNKEELKNIIGDKLIEIDDTFLTFKFKGSLNELLLFLKEKEIIINIKKYKYSEEFFFIAKFKKSNLEIYTS